MIRSFILVSALFAYSWCAAALPDAVAQACLSPSVTDTTTGQTWTLMTAEAWDAGAMEIIENSDATITAQSGKPHPLSWITTKIRIATPTADEAHLQQTLTIQLKMLGVVPKTTCTINLLDNALLPPCKVIPWQGKLAVVSEQNDWFIVAEDVEMKVTQTAEKQPRTSIRLANVTLEKFTTTEASIRIGEGPLR